MCSNADEIKGDFHIVIGKGLVHEIDLFLFLSLGIVGDVEIRVLGDVNDGGDNYRFEGGQCGSNTPLDFYRFPIGQINPVFHA